MAIRTMTQLQKTPVVIMTASLREGEEDKAHSLGAVSYLTKPFGVDELLRQIKQVLGE